MTAGQKAKLRECIDHEGWMVGEECPDPETATEAELQELAEYFYGNMSVPA